MGNKYAVMGFRSLLVGINEPSSKKAGNENVRFPDLWIVFIYPLSQLWNRKNLLTERLMGRLH
jgi:hypothetical protein